MTWEAIDTILSKAWDINAHASIKADVEIVICKEAHDWITYPTLNLLCIYSKWNNKEYYYDVDDIKKITIIFDESRRNQTEKIGVE